MSALLNAVQIIKSNLKNNLFPHLMLTLLLLLLTPAIFSISNLNARAAAGPMEAFVALSGVLLLTPLYYPEQKGTIGETVEAKYISHLQVMFLRFLTAWILIALAIMLFAGIMLYCGSSITGKLIFGTLASAVFLGALGMLAACVSGNIAVGYMIPVIYYVFNFAMGSKLGNFYLFSLMHDSFSEKPWLMGGGIVLATAAFFVQYIRMKSR